MPWVSCSVIAGSAKGPNVLGDRLRGIEVKASKQGTGNELESAVSSQRQTGYAMRIVLHRMPACHTGWDRRQKG